jgi:hypothetical protein
VANAAKHVRSPLSVNVVQAAFPEDAPEDGDGPLKRLLVGAIEKAGRCARRRGVPADLQALRELAQEL